VQLADEQPCFDNCGVSAGLQVAAERPEDPSPRGGWLMARDGLLLTREYGPRGDLSRSPRTLDGAV